MTDKEIKDKIIKGIKDWFDDVEGYNYSSNHEYTVFTVKDYDKAIVSYFNVAYGDIEAQINTGNLDIDDMVKYYKQQANFYNQRVFWNHNFIESYFESVIKQKLPNNDTIFVNLKRGI